MVELKAGGLMSFSVLEKQVQELPLDLQKRIEMYVLFVINQYKNSCPGHNRNVLRFPAGKQAEQSRQ